MIRLGSCSLDGYDKMGDLIERQKWSSCTVTPFNTHTHTHIYIYICIQDSYIFMNNKVLIYLSQSSQVL